MDFFTQQEKARKKTGLLVISFVAAVILIIAALYTSITAVLFFNDVIANPFQVELLVAVVAITLTIVAIGSLFKMRQLQKGGSAVAEMLGAKRVSSETKDFKEKQLLNVVEEMAIASGSSVPAVYVIEEQGVNAFAAGWKATDAAVCVTRGCLAHLTRDELQGVIAHEFSHIFNGDMRLNIKLMGMVFGILVIGQIGYWVLRGTGRSRGMRVRSKGKGGGGVALVMVVALLLLVIGYIGVFFGNLIKAAVSRSREFLADASAVQFTRNPAGIAGALKKIGGLADGSRITHPNASQASHFFFASGLSGFWSTLFATHPPLNERIAAIEPSFDGKFPVVKKTDSAGVSPGPQRNVPGAAAATSGLRFDPALLLASVGMPTAEHIAYSSQQVRDIPNNLRMAVMDRIGAQAAVAALLLSTDPAIRERQELALAAADARLQPRVAGIAQLAAGLDRSHYATVFSLSVNALRSMEEKEYRCFIALIKLLVEADGKIELLEYLLMRMVRRTLESRFTDNVRPGKTVRSIKDVASDASMLLSVVAWEGADSLEAANRAFGAGAITLAETRVALVPREACSLESLDASLETLDRLLPLLKKKLLAASTAVAAQDGSVTVSEAEYLRVIAEALECPMPPFIV